MKKKNHLPKKKKNKNMILKTEKKKKNVSSGVFPGSYSAIST